MRWKWCSLRSSKIGFGQVGDALRGQSWLEFKGCECHLDQCELMRFAETVDWNLKRAAFPFLEIQFGMREPARTPSTVWLTFAPEYCARRS